MTSGLSLQNLTIRQGQTDLVRLSVTVAPRQVVTIMGPSGSGKSTLLAAIVGTLDPSFALSGQIDLNGRRINDLPIRERHVGLLFQDAVLFPHLSVAGNLAFALPPDLRPRAARDAAVADALAAAGLSGLGAQDPTRLSGGQRARVALMRTLLAEPKALLLDEPFTSLDATLRQHIRSFVFETAIARDLPVILVTHDPEDARAAGGPVLSPLGEPVSL